MRWKKEGSEGGKGVYVTQFQTNFSSMQFHSQVVQVCVMMHGHSSVDTGDVSHRNQSSGNSHVTLHFLSQFLSVSLMVSLHNLIHTYLWWRWSSWIWHTSRWWGVAGGLLRGVASQSRWVSSSRGIGHLQQKAGRQVYRFTATTVNDHQELLKHTCSTRLT